MSKIEDSVADQKRQLIEDIKTARHLAGVIFDNDGRVYGFSMGETNPKELALAIVTLTKVSDHMLGNIMKQCTEEEAQQLLEYMRKNAKGHEEVNLYEERED